MAWILIPVERTNNRSNAMQFKTFWIVALALTAGIAAGASAETPDSSKQMNMTSKAEFVQKAAQGGMAEVELSRLAATRSASQDVKKFAARMVSEHTKNNADLAQIARSEGLTVPAQLDADHLALKEKLANAKGADFDRLYVQTMRGDHTDMLHLLDGAKDIDDAKLKDYVASTRPVVAAHLKMANELTGP